MPCHWRDVWWKRITRFVGEATELQKYTTPPSPWPQMECKSTFFAVPYFLFRGLIRADTITTRNIRYESIVEDNRNFQGRQICCKWHLFRRIRDSQVTATVWLQVMQRELQLHGYYKAESNRRRTLSITLICTAVVSGGRKILALWTRPPSVQIRMPSEGMCVLLERFHAQFQCRVVCCCAFQKGKIKVPWKVGLMAVRGGF